MAFLKETLAAINKKEEIPGIVIGAPIVEAPQEVQVETVADAVAEEPIAEVEPSRDGPAYRVFNFAYRFKTGASIIEADKWGVYTPKDAAEKEYLDWQVSQGRITHG